MEINVRHSSLFIMSINDNVFEDFEDNTRHILLDAAANSFTFLWVLEKMW